MLSESSSASLFLLLKSLTIHNPIRIITPVIIVHASALIVENLGPRILNTNTTKAEINPFFVPNCMKIATIGKIANPVTT